MKRSEKAARIITILDELHPETPIPLDHQNHFQLLVAVLMSAQTTDNKVNQVTPALFAIAPDAESMAKTEIATILKIIRQIGLAPTKSRNIHNLSKMLVSRFAGVVPQTFAELEDLPGVGHKTASVVMAQAFAIPAFAVDTHIHRLAARWGLSKAKNVEQTERDLKRVFPKEKWIKLHLQMIFFARESCPARGHNLNLCPICSWAASAKRKHAEMS
jgi:endonuclease-3